MPSPRDSRTDDASRKGSPRIARCDIEVPPTGQSPDDPIEFENDDDVACGNAERANAEPEPAATHAAEVPGKPDLAKRRRAIEKQAEKSSDDR